MPKIESEIMVGLADKNPMAGIAGYHSLHRTASYVTNFEPWQTPARHPLGGTAAGTSAGLVHPADLRPAPAAEASAAALPDTGPMHHAGPAKQQPAGTSLSQAQDTHHRMKASG